MKYFSNVIRIHNCWNRFGIEYVVWDIFLCHFFSCAQQLKVKKLPTRKNFDPTKYQREKILDPRNTHEKKIWHPRNIHEKKIWTHKIPTTARWHDGTRPTRRTMMAPDSWNLAQSIISTTYFHVKDLWSRCNL